MGKHSLRIAIIGPNMNWAKQDVEFLKSKGFDAILISDNYFSILRNLHNIINSDIIFEWFAFPLGVFLGKAFNKIVVLNAVGWEFFEFGYASNWYRKLLIEIGLKNADKIVAISRKSLKLAKEVYNSENSEVIYEAINTKKFGFKKYNYKKEIQEIKVTTIAHLHYINIIRKDLITLIKSIYYIINKLPNVKFIFIGNITKDASVLSKIAEQLKVSRYIEFKGFVDDDKLLEILKSSDLFVMPSLYEGFPTVLSEALSCGIPVVTTNRPTMNEIFKNNIHAIMVEPRDPKMLADAIIGVISDKKQSLKLAINGRRLIESRYSEKIRAEKLEKVFTALKKKKNNRKFKLLSITYFIILMLILLILPIERLIDSIRKPTEDKLLQGFLSI